MRQFQSIRILIALLLCTSLAISTEHFQFTETGQYELINLGNIYLSEDPVEEGSEVAVFDGDLCVGAVIYSGLAGQQLLAWADDPTTDELDGFTEGNLISFKVYVSSLDTVYQGLSANYIAYPGWDTSGLFHVDEVCGVNLSYDLPTQNIALSSNWNLMSLNIVPYEADSVLEILSPIHNNLIYVFDEQFNLIRWDVNDWSDGIGLWEPTEGYYIKLDSGQNLSVLASGPISMPFSIPLNTGWNIVSFPIQNVSGQSVEHVFGEIMNSIEMIFNWNGSLYLPGGDPFNMYPGKAYLVKTTQNETLVINDSGGFGTMIAEGTDVNQGQFRTGHFQPVWEGTPFTPMAFVLNEAMWNYLDIEPGDEVGIFDGNICVGAFTVPDEGFAPGSQIPTSKDDGSGNGFIEGHPVSFRVWKENVVTEIDADIISFSDVVSGSSTAAVFSALSGVEVEISVQPPSMPGSFSLAGGSAQVSLSWSTPSQGNYNIYENGVPSQAIFYELYRDGSLLLESFQTNNYTDSGLSHNALYEYELKAVSVVDDSESSSNSSLTLPGVPVFSPHVADINEVLLSWVDAESSGSDSEIVYSLMRKWLVDGYEYNESLVSNYDQYDFIDQTLLNSSEFFYRVKAKNATGFSSWSGYSPVTTLSPPSGVPDAVVIVSDSVTQTYVPPQNLVTLNWFSFAGVESYHLYERNLLVATDINRNAKLFLDNPKLLKDVLQHQRLIRRLDEIHLLDNLRVLINYNYIFSAEFQIVCKFMNDGYSGKGWNHYDSSLGEIYWPIEEASWLRLTSNLQQLSDSIKKFLLFIETKYGLNTSKTVLDDLIRFQLFLLTTKDQKHKTKNRKFNFDWKLFFTTDSELNQGDNEYQYNNLVTCPDIFTWNYETIWFGRFKQKYKISPKKLANINSCDINYEKLGKEITL